MIEQEFLQQIVATTSNHNNPDSLVEEIAQLEYTVTYIYQLNGNSESASLLNKLRVNENMDPKDKNYGLVAFAIINHILNEDGKSPEETNIKQHKETLIEFLLLMNNERPNLIKDVLSSLEENTNHIPTYLLILNKAMESNNVSVTSLRSVRNEEIIKAIINKSDPTDITDDAYYDGKINHFKQENKVLQELFVLYQKVAEQKRKAEEEARKVAEAEEARKAAEAEEEARKVAEAEESRKAAAAKLLQASIRRLKPRKAAEAEEARKAEEEARKVAEQERKAAERARKAAEEARKAEAKRKAEEEEARRKAEEARRKAEEEAARRKDKKEAARRKADEARRKADEARRKADEARRKAEEARRKAEEEAARRKAEEEVKKKSEEEAANLLQGYIRRSLEKKNKDKEERKSYELYQKLLKKIEIPKGVSEDDKEKYQEYLDQLINPNTPFLTYNNAHIDIDIDIKKELLKQLLSFSPRKEIKDLISKELGSIQGNLKDYLDCFCDKIEDLELLSGNIIKDKKLVEKLIDIASNTDKGKVIIQYFYNKRENITLTGNNFEEIFKIILNNPDFFKKYTDGKIQYLKFLACSIDKDISHDLIGLMENFALETERADIKNQIYLMLLLDKNGIFFTKDLFDQYKMFYNDNQDNETLKRGFLSAIEKSKETLVQYYIARKLLEALEISSERKEYNINAFTEEELRNPSLVFLEKLCKEIIATPTNRLTEFKKELNTNNIPESSRLYDLFIDFFIKKYINETETLSKFFPEIGSDHLTLDQIYILLSNPQNINLLEFKLKQDPEIYMRHGLDFHNLALCEFLVYNSLILPSNHLKLIQEYEKLKSHKSDIEYILYYGGNHPELETSSGLNEGYEKATSLLLSVSIEERSHLLIPFFRLALELKVDLKPILDKFIQENYETELLNIIQILPPDSVKYLLINSKKLIANEKLEKYTQTILDPNQFWKVIMDIDLPSLERQQIFACLYKLDGVSFGDEDVGLIKERYGQDWRDAFEAHKKYQDIIRKYDQGILTANDLNQVNLSMILNNGVPLFLMLCKSNDFNEIVLKSIQNSVTGEIFLTDEQGKNILHILIESKNRTLLESLLKDKDLQHDVKQLSGMLDNKGNSIFNFVDNQQDIHSLLKDLFESGISPNIHDKYGNTPLINACRCYLQSKSDKERHTAIFEVLFVHGADPNIKIGTKTMLDIFLSKNDLKLVELALKKCDNIAISASNITKLIECLDKIENSKANYEDDGQKKEFDGKKERLKSRILDIIDLAIDKEKAEITNEHALSVLNIMKAQDKDQEHKDLKNLYRKFLDKMRKEAGMGNRGLLRVGSLPSMIGGNPPPYIESLMALDARYVGIAAQSGRPLEPMRPGAAAGAAGFCK